MQRLLTVAVAALLAMPGMGADGALAAQETAAFEPQRGPQFLYATTSKSTVPLDVARVPVLRQRLALDLQGVSLKDAIAQIAREAGIVLWYSDDVLRRDTPVHLRAEKITVAAALTDVLMDAGVDVVFSRDGSASLVKRVATAVVPLVGVVSGRVTDSTNGDGISGVTVAVQGTRLVSTSEADGAYTIRGVPAGNATLTARRLGYRTKSRVVEVAENATVTADFVLGRVPTVLNEIVVTPTGERQRLEVGNAIGTIKADSIVATSLIRSMSDLVTARIPGVIVQNSTGAVGAPSRIRIRGINSLQLNNDPIIILDGVRLASHTTRANSQVEVGNTMMPSVTFTFAADAPPAPSRFDDIDPNMIESLDILRGPSAAALYGTEAANGVIVIKTKRGKVGPFRFNLLADNGWSLVPQRMPELWYGWGRAADPFSRQDCLLVAVAAGTCTQDSVTHFNVAKDPNMGVLGTGTARNLSASMSGGTEQLTEFVALRVSDQVGMSKMSAAEERRISRMWDAPPPSWMKRPNTATDLNGTSRTNLRVGTKLDLSLSAHGIYRDVLSGMQTLVDDVGVCFNFSVLCAQGPGDTLRYLPSESQRGKQSSSAKRGTASVSGKYLPFPWLALRANVGGDFTLRTDEALALANDCTRLLNPAGCQGRRMTDRSELFVRTMDFGAQFNFAPLSWLGLQTGVGEQFANTRYYGLNASNGFSTTLGFGTELLTPQPVPISGTPQLYSITETRDESATAGWYLEQVATIRDRLFLTAALRRDAASAFGPNVNAKLPTYPKFSASWLASDEPFFPDLPLPLSFRLRAAYGHSGIQASQLDVLANYTQGTAFVDGVITPGIVLRQISNPDLEPERTTEWEVGFDLSLFDNDRIQIEATMYRKLSKDAIMQRTLPMSYGTASGFPGVGSNRSQRANIGSVENRGSELSVMSKLIDSRPFGWNLNVHFTKNSNKLVTAFANQAPQGAASFVVGYPLYGIWNYEVASYQDLNGDGLLGRDEIVWSTGDPAVGRGFVFKGAPYPRAEVVWDNGFVLLSGALRVGFKLDQIIGQVVRVNFGPTGTRCRVDPTCSLAQQALAVEALGSINGSAREASYLRFSEVQTTYNAPASIARRFLRAQSASVTLAARNLAVWSNWTAGDPNIGGFDSGSELGGSVLSNTRVYPQPRNLTVRLNLGF